MKWIVASDIHGSALYCRKLLEAFESAQADRLLLLGDLLYHGPRNALPPEYDPQQVAHMLNAYAASVLCVRGNCEAEVDQMMLTFPVLAEYALLSVKGRLVFATHGHTWNNAHLPPLQPQDVLLHGHTHIPACEQADTHLYLNPGSVSLPKEDSPHGYMLLDDQSGEVLWYDLDGNLCHRTTL